jgi:phosphate transport system substrate-binding protein
MQRPPIFAAALLALALSGCGDAAGDAGSRDQIKIVGSSTVYPFTTLVAQRYVTANQGAKTPVVEENGTGGGFKLFCAGVGAAHPDIADASRRMRASEYATCKEHGIEDIMEVQVGIDGIALAEAANGPKLELTNADVYKALAANPLGKPNAARTWADVNSSLPKIPIQVYGPPATSGTRDALAELIMGRGCEAVYPDMVGKREKDAAAFAKGCTTIRTDGAYVDAGENDNLIVQKLSANPDAVGVFGYSYLEENAGTLRGIPLNGVAPDAGSIAKGTYAGARPLYLYVKKAHLNAVRGLKDFLSTYATMWGPGGPLARRGLIVAPDDVRQRAAEIVSKHRTLNPATLT